MAEGPYLGRPQICIDGRDHGDPRTGDAVAALEYEPVRITARYVTPMQHHNPMELFTTACVWDGSGLTVYEPTRYLGAVRHRLASQFGLDPENVRVVSGFIGGHFGSKFALSQHTALIALAAQRIGRPVPLVPTRRQCFTIANYRPETRPDVHLGAERDSGCFGTSELGSGKVQRRFRASFFNWTHLRLVAQVGAGYAVS